MGVNSVINSVSYKSESENLASSDLCNVSTLSHIIIGSAMLRDDINESLKFAMKAKNKRAVSTLRLIMAAVKDRDVAARGKGNAEGISDGDVMQVLQTMVRQRQDSIKLYEQGGRQDLVEQETEETAIIRGFLPEPMDEAAIAAAVDAAVTETGATGLKDMGRAMGLLRQGYAGRMNFGAASAMLKQRLGG